MFNQLPNVVVVAIFVVANVGLAHLGLLIFRRVIREEVITNHTSVPHIASCAHAAFTKMAA